MAEVRLGISPAAFFAVVALGHRRRRPPAA